VVRPDVAASFLLCSVASVLLDALAVVSQRGYLSMTDQSSPRQLTGKCEVCGKPAPWSIYRVVPSVARNGDEMRVGNLDHEWCADHYTPPKDRGIHPCQSILIES
jgi:hypothetical protein